MQYKVFMQNMKYSVKYKWRNDKKINIEKV